MGSNIPGIDSRARQILLRPSGHFIGRRILLKAPGKPVPSSNLLGIVSMPFIHHLFRPPDRLPVVG